jgi:uncharacterized protein YdaU (DUF1376 family)
MATSVAQLARRLFLPVKNTRVQPFPVPVWTCKPLCVRAGQHIAEAEINYYPFHLGDYAAHTAHLEPMEDLAYRRMLDLYYRTEKPLSDPSEIARLIRMREHAATIRDVLNEFFEATDDGWVHARCEAEIAKMQDKQAKARASAQASVNARSTNAQRTLNERPAAVELPTPTPTPKKDISTAAQSHPPAGGLAAGFAEFWEAWPAGERKHDKAKCLAKWKRCGLGLLADVILADVRVKRGTQKWADGFVEAPLVYLNGKRWEDGVEPEVPKPATAAITVPSKADEQTAALLAEQAAHAAMSQSPEATAARIAAMAKLSIRRGPA